MVSGKVVFRPVLKLFIQAITFRSLLHLKLSRCIFISIMRSPDHLVVVLPIWIPSCSYTISFGSHNSILFQLLPWFSITSPAHKLLFPFPLYHWYRSLSIFLRIGCRFQYVKLRQSHSSGPKRKYFNQIGQAINWNIQMPMTI